MRGKNIYIIIGIVVFIVIIIGVLIFSLLSSNNKPVEKNNISNSGVADQPVITLNKKVNENNPEKVTITAYATIEDKTGIKEIILPDGKSVAGETANYSVQENGIYEFKAVSNNGSTATSKIEITEIEESSSNNPYIPEGFEKVDGDVETGFVIEDSYGNQYVWIPVEDGKLIRDKNKDYEETESSASDLVNSVAKYYGFYLAKFEGSKYEDGEKIAAASVSGKKPWTNITYLEALKYAKDTAKIFEYEDCKTSLVNSYVWDTTLKWINKTTSKYSSNTNYGNYSGTIYPTGNTESDVVNNICDLAGNVREWSTETFSGTVTSSSNRTASKDSSEDIKQRVVRGGSANIGTPPENRIYYPENTSDNYWGFRIILYR